MATCCCVCLEVPSAAVRLKCGHELCGGCLEVLERESTRLRQAQACPVCRRPLPRVLAAQERGEACVRRARGLSGAARRQALLGAVAAFRSVADATGDALELGRVLAELGSPAAEKVLADYPETLGLAYLRWGDPRRAARIAPETPLGLVVRSRALLLLGDARGAAAAARRALPSAEARFRLGMALNALGDIEGAKRAWASEAADSDASDYQSSSDSDARPEDEAPLLEDERFDADASAALHAAMLGGKRNRGLLRAAMRRARRPAVRAQAALQLGLAYLERPRSLGRSARALRRAALWPPARALALTKLGEIRLLQNDRVSAREALREALDLEPDRVSALLRLAEALRGEREANALRRRALALVASTRQLVLAVASGDVFFSHPTTLGSWLPTLATNACTPSPDDDDDDDDDDFKRNSRPPTSLARATAAAQIQASATPDALRALFPLAAAN
ncbi:hypothetical protein CTAYLR_004319 [Chrysophaeum taylorii]|uniref:RING-type domain-containing protein n=1 Tax=Chrysophaeum taylorii TaxID=2483200 RepID=A0AAD7UFW6_9STRA|nr:hypothetical protein CTAYLR_004319 [Chrysophaeum taylorii]